MMAKSYGWTGKILWVDLTDRKITNVPTSDFEPEKYLGGVGLNTKIFWELGSPEVSAFHPDNPLLISIGPLTGAVGPFNRAEVGGIAPQSYPQELFNYSGFGGKFPSELKYAGYDGIVILGKADKPVYLSINDGDVVIKDAGHVWGLDTFETQKALREDHPGASVLTMGPAGENLSRIAILLNETASAAGQGGYGAVMGSKKLKAIVLKGSGTLKMADPKGFMNLLDARKTRGELEIGDLQRWGRYPQAGRDVVGKMVGKHLKKFSGCHGCTFQCNGFYGIPGVGKGGQMCVEAWYAGFSGSSAEGLWEGNILSQKLGINNYDLMGLMNFAIAGVYGQVFTEKDIALPPIPAIHSGWKGEFGGKEKHHKFLEALMRGIVDGASPFHQGVARAAEGLGPKAMELFNALYPAHGMRSHWIVGISPALHWATDTRDPFNSAHDYTMCFGHDTRVAKHFGVRGGYLRGWRRKNVYGGSEKETWWVQSHQALKNSLPICEYGSIPSLFFDPPKMDIRIFESRILAAVTGLDLSPDQLWETGERIWSLRRAVMVKRENRTREGDTLSHVWFERKSDGGQELPEPIDRKEWEALKDRYYGLLGWNSTNGRPTRARLEKLGMKGVADGLKRAGRLG